MPKWLRSACGRLITQLFISRPPDGSKNQPPLKDLVAGILDVHSTDPRHIPAVASVVAHILATPPQISEQMCATELYYKSLALQITDSLRTGKTDPVTFSHVTRLIAIDTIHQICTRDLELGKRLFLDGAVFYKLGKIVLQSNLENEALGFNAKPFGAIDVSDAAELISAEDLQSVIEFVSEVFI